MTSIASTPRLTPGPVSATLAIAVAAVFFGLVPLFARDLQALGFDDAAIALYRFLFTALVTLPFLPRTREKRRQALLLGVSGFLTGIGWVAYLHAIEAAPVAAAGVVYMSYPVFTLLFAWLLLKRRPGPRAWGACALVLTGAGLLMSRGEFTGSVPALLLSLPAPIFFGLIVVVLSAMVAKLSALEKISCSMGGAVLGLLPLAMLAEPAALVPASSEAWIAVLGLGVLTALIPQIIYTIACPLLGPARTATTSSFELPTMIAVGWFAFAESVGPFEVAAALLVLCAIVLTPSIAAPDRRNHAHKRHLAAG